MHVMNVAPSSTVLYQYSLVYPHSLGVITDITLLKFLDN